MMCHDLDWWIDWFQFNPVQSNPVQSNPIQSSPVQHCQQQNESKTKTKNNAFHLSLSLSRKKNESCMDSVSTFLERERGVVIVVRRNSGWSRKGTHFPNSMTTWRLSSLIFTTIKQTDQQTNQKSDPIHFSLCVCHKHKHKHHHKNKNKTDKVDSIDINEQN